MHLKTASEIFRLGGKDKIQLAFTWLPLYQFQIMQASLSLDTQVQAGTQPTCVHAQPQAFGEASHFRHDFPEVFLMLQ